MFPFSVPFLLSITFPSKVKAPIDSTFPLAFPVRLPPILTSLPFINPSVLSTAPVMFIPFSVSVSAFLLSSCFFGKMKKLLPVIFPYPDFSFSINTL